MTNSISQMEIETATDNVSVPDTMEEYVNKAVRTLSDGFHSDKVSPQKFLLHLQECIVALQQLDKCKKALFYGKEPDFDYHIEDDFDEDDLYQMEIKLDVVHPDILHGIIGVATEAGEMLEALALALLDQQEFDEVNLTEEMGDVFWYMAVLANRTGRPFSESMRINIAKLEKRYPEKFTEELAINRDVEAERKLLENESQRN